MTEIVIADDHQMMIDGIISLLKEQPGIKIIGTALNGKSALEIIENIRPDLLIADINMPEMSGIELTKAVKAAFPAVKVLILTMYNEGGIINELVQAGADGYILKNTGRQELLSAIATIMAGRLHYDDQVVETMLREKHQPANPRADAQAEKVDLLTRREKEIIRLIVEEQTTAQIAEQLHISTRTVETHRKNIIRKTGVKNIVGLVKFAIESGLVKA